MQEFMLSPPLAILYLAGGILLVALASVFLKKSSPTRKVVALGITVVVLIGLVLYVYRPVTIRVDDSGLHVEGRGGVELAWDEVDSAVFATDLRSSPFRPTVRTRGVAVGDYRTGRFLLSNGDAARVYMERSDAAVVVRTDELTYLFAPEDVDGLAEAIDTYRIIEGGTE